MHETYICHICRSPFTHQDGDAFVVSDDRSPKMKKRSPLTANTKHCDDSIYFPIAPTTPPPTL
ncbi:MAG: hypothetical protein WBA89_25175 [Microcoleus sp.]|uniref:hypothetical protein n=1 Tax=Microcoleus sp. TaxID=44472 RepID=UPI003C744C50